MTGFIQEKYNSCGHLVVWNWMYNQVSTHQHFPCLSAHLPTFSVCGSPLPTFSSSSWMGSFDLSKQMRCSHWEPTTPLDQALGEHTSHSNPTLRVCASFSPGIEMSALGHSKSWVLYRMWEGLKRFSLIWGWGNFFSEGRTIDWEPTDGLGVRLPCGEEVV